MKVRIESGHCTLKVSGYALEEMLANPKRLGRVFLDSKRQYDLFVDTFFPQNEDNVELCSFGWRAANIAYFYCL